MEKAAALVLTWSSNASHLPMECLDPVATVALCFHAFLSSHYYFFLYIHISYLTEKQMITGQILASFRQAFHYMHKWFQPYME